MMHERSNSFFIDGSVAQTERQGSSNVKTGQKHQTNSQAILPTGH